MVTTNIYCEYCNCNSLGRITSNSYPKSDLFECSNCKKETYYQWYHNNSNNNIKNNWIYYWNNDNKHDWIEMLTNNSNFINKLKRTGIKCIPIAVMCVELELLFKLN